jgi:hypothetical protein
MNRDHSGLVARYLLIAIAPWCADSGAGRYSLVLMSFQQMLTCVARTAAEQGLAPSDVSGESGQAALEAIAMALNFSTRGAWCWTSSDSATFWTLPHDWMSVVRLARVHAER